MAVVWVAVADYGLNGAEVLEVFDHEPTAEELEESILFSNRGVEVTRHEVKENR